MSDDSHGFEELCVKYRPLLRSIVEARMDLELQRRIDPSDVVQEALLEAYQRFEDYRQRKPMPLMHWLRSTAIQQLRIAIRRHRTAGKRSIRREVRADESSLFFLAERIAYENETVQDRRLKTEELERTWKALLQLSPPHREILLLRYLHSLSNAESARILGVSETVASKRHCRALVSLQQILS